MNSKNRIKFVNKDKNLFFTTLKQRVENYFEENKLSKHANTEAILKSIILLSGYIIPFVIVLSFPVSFAVNLLLWIVMGISLAGIGMSIMHDANHGAYSGNKGVNFMMGHTLNLLGGSVFNWKLQHNILHHTYTNIATMDEDIQDKLVLRFSPHTKVKSYHRFQWLYAFLFYGIITIYWTTLKDIIQFFKFTRNGVNPNNKKQNRITLFKIIVAKLVYFFVILAVPIVFFHVPILEILTGFLAMHFVAGIILTVVFQLAHTVEGTEYPLPNIRGNIENEWAIHQMNTTVNFSRKSKIISWYVGGLNFQIEHHLFPKICHVHYPRIADIVKQTAQEFDIPYMENKTFLRAVRSHIATLRNFGKLPNINEAIV
jgi:linoleoyl-CoA desaturase